MHHDTISTEPHHGHGLAEDFFVLSRLAHRRRALAWMAAVSGSPLFDPCGDGGGSSETPAASVAASISGSTTTATTATASTTPTMAGSSADGCVAPATNGIAR